MSGIGELAYMLLLGWMRALVDWFWLMVSGGSSGGWQWFLSNWKIWLVILLGGGLVIDWLMWMVRWRPYRVLLSRFSHAPKDVAPTYEESWDDGVGYYAPETMLDQEPSDWSTLSTLSEIDPDWAGDVVIDVDTPPTGGVLAKTYFYNEDYEEPAEAYVNAENASGYWEEEEEQGQENDPPTVQWQAIPYADDDADQPVQTRYMPLDNQAAQYEEADYFDDDDPNAQAGTWVNISSADDEEPEQGTEAPGHYGRPTLWPGSFPYAEQMEAEDRPHGQVEPSPINYYADEAFEDNIQDDPLFATDYKVRERPDRQSRQLRKLRKSDHDASRRRRSNPMPEENDDDFTALDENRPGRLVRPVSVVPENESKTVAEFRTVTGKPVKRQGIIRLAATDDEPIPGLPPLQLENPFLPKAMPKNPDFSDDDGNWR